MMVPMAADDARPLYVDVPGQDAAVAALRAAASRPVHAYLFVGPPGTGKVAAATDFAAHLLCPNGGDGTCDVCRRVRIGAHPDVATVEREGAAISIGSAQEVIRLAARSPTERDRKVLVLTDFHLVREAGPALLKTIEEPPPSAVFVILAEHVPPELVTIASRCVRIDFVPVPPATVAALLTAEGIPAAHATALAEATGGRLDRARLLAGDAEFAARRDAWLAVPGRLDGSGATAAVVADELVALLERSVEPLRARHQLQASQFEARLARDVEVNGKRRRGRFGPDGGAKELEERHKREVRRQRTDELRSGLATLAGAYRDRLASDEAGGRVAAGAVTLIHRTGASLEYNPGELLALQALLVRVGRLGLTVRRG